MQIVYGFIYYFTIFMVTCTCLLSVFIVPLLRRMLVRFWRSYQNLLQHDLVKYLKMISFSLIGLVFLQSAYVLFILESHFSRRSERFVRRMGGLENLDMVVPQMQNREGYLLALKEYRQFYLAQRNILLVISACFAFFVFQRILYNIRKYAQVEHDLSENSRIVEADDGHLKRK